MKQRWENTRIIMGEQTITIDDPLAGSEYVGSGVKSITIYCNPMIESICPDCGMLFEFCPKREWKNSRCPYCNKPFMAKILIQAFWLEGGESGASALE